MKKWIFVTVLLLAIIAFLIWINTAGRLWWIRFLLSLPISGKAISILAGWG